jgi:hypothetical protein
MPRASTRFFRKLQQEGGSLPARTVSGRARLSDKPSTPARRWLGSMSSTVEVRTSAVKQSGLDRMPTSWRLVERGASLAWSMCRASDRPGYSGQMVLLAHCSPAITPSFSTSEKFRFPLSAWGRLVTVRGRGADPTGLAGGYAGPATPMRDHLLSTAQIFLPRKPRR